MISRVLQISKQVALHQIIITLIFKTHTFKESTVPISLVSTSAAVLLLPISTSETIVQSLKKA